MLAYLDLDNTLLGGEDINAVSYAAHYGKIDVFKVLVLERGAKVDIPDPYWKQCPLFRAIKGGSALHIDIVRIIVGMPPEARNLNSKDRDGQTALAAAAAFGVVEGVKILLDAGADATV